MESTRKMTVKSLISCGASLLLALLLLPCLLVSGCASASVTPTIVAPGTLPKPDVIVIHDFAVTPAEVKLDQGVMASAVRDAKPATQSDEQVRVGHLVADKLAQSLVEELTAAGIPAVRASANVRPTQTTAILTGEFISIDQGNQTARVWVGFGLGGGELRTRIQVVQGGQLAAQAETATKANLKPGMLVSIGAGAATGGVAPVVVGAAGTGVSEAFMSTVEADAKRTAKEIAKRIRKAYVDRGWTNG